MAISLSDILEIIIVAALGAYFIVGLVVSLFLVFRGPKISRPPRDGVLWEEKDNERNLHYWIFTVTVSHPITFVLHLLIWPFWFMSYLDSLEEEETPPQYLGPPDDDPPRRQED